MRSMDETRTHGGPDMANGLPRGRPQRAMSPNYDSYDRRPARQRPRQRQGDASTDEIIRFVRGYQMEREPTLMRLQKKAVLPGIGQLTQSMTADHPRRESDSDEDLDEDSLVDSEVAAIEANHRSQLQDLGVYDEFPFPPARVTRRNQKTAASYSQQQTSHLHIVRPLDTHSGGRNGGRGAHARARLGKPLRSLPPIARDELPERPSAPSPLSPPEEEELDSAGEPVDFIDAS